jgi:acyl carrier protein
MAIEEEFSIEIPDKEADAIHSGMSRIFSECNRRLIQ